MYYDIQCSPQDYLPSMIFMMKEIEKEEFAFIGNHSHSHEYLIEKSNQDFINDIEKANLILTHEFSSFKNNDEWKPTSMEKKKSS